VLPVAIGWSDVGSWDALQAVSPRDEAGNAIAGDVLALGARGCLIRSEGPLVAAIGIEDLVVIATEDAVLIVPKAQSQRVREAVEALKQAGREKLL
jgi:mannose-1-phosphate guanylyltransferase